MKSQKGNMNLFVAFYRKFTGVSREYAIAVWYGLPDNLRDSPQYAAEIKARDFRYKGVK